jgi:hypothetical protein
MSTTRGVWGSDHPHGGGAPGETGSTAAPAGLLEPYDFAHFSWAQQDLNAGPESCETLRTAAESGETVEGSPPETSIRSRSRGLQEDLAYALALAAEAGEWRIVETLARQLDRLRSASDGGEVRMLHGAGRATPLPKQR